MGSTGLQDAALPGCCVPSSTSRHLSQPLCQPREASLRIETTQPRADREPGTEQVPQSDPLLWSGPCMHACTLPAGANEKITFAVLHAPAKWG